jgi:hypothetical protein
MKKSTRRLLFLAFSILAAPWAMHSALAENSWRMTYLSSDPAGYWQFIQLVESQGLNGQDHFAGLELSVTSRSGLVKRFKFPTDLLSSLTAGRHVLIGTAQGSDFTIPQGFLPTDGGTIEFAGIDTWSYDALPANGFTALSRIGPVWMSEYGSSPPAGYNGVLNVLALFSGELWTPPIVRAESIVEYYSPPLDHYFLTGFQPDIDALDSGRIPGWLRTGESFYAWVNLYYDGLSDDPGVSEERQPDNLRPVCRLYLPPVDGDSHFFSASSDECAAASQGHSEYILETPQAFLATLPDQTGQCAQGAQPVYRLWNGRIDSNHRYTTSLQTRDEMLTRGYIAEGYGPNRVAMCVGGASQ